MAQPDPVTVLGAGPVGATLARALARSGRTVTIGVRHPQADPVRELLAQLGAGSLAATPGDAIRANHIIVAAVPGPARWRSPTPPVPGAPTARPSMPGCPT